MNRFLVCFVSLTVISMCFEVQAQIQENGFYDSRYDYLDIDTIMDNKRLVRNYVECLLNEKPCTAEGKQLRRILPEGLRTKCARCTARQKQNALIILRKLRSEYPKEWDRLTARWDPTGDITRRFEDYLEKDDNNRIGDEKPFKTTPTPSPPRPAILNRIDPTEDEQQAPSEIKPTIRSISSTTMRVTSSPSTLDETTRSTITKKTEKPTTTPRYKTKTTRRPYIDIKPPPSPVNLDLTPIYAGTMGIIDHFGNKIIRTTEFVTDILRNTVRVVVGPHANRN